MRRQGNRPRAAGRYGSRKRVWAFRALAIAIGLLPWAAAECWFRYREGRRAATADPWGEASDDEPWASVAGHRPLFRLACVDGGRWVIPEERMNFFCPASFAAVKPAGTRRVFVLGGSTTQGRPFATETSFAAWLELQLRAAAPADRFEVVNVGGVSYASYRVAGILDEVLGHRPDAIVLYTGHNEFLEEQSYRATRSSGNAAADWLASRSALARRLRRGFAGADSRSGETTRPNPDGSDPVRFAAEVSARLDRAGGLRDYRRDPEHWRRIEAEFATTLRRMAGRCREAAVPLVLCVPASDLVATPPFKVEIDGTLEPPARDRAERCWEVVEDREASSEAKLRAAWQCLRIDPGHAGAHYVAGRLLQDRLRRGIPADREDPIATHLRAARDWDVCPLRARTAMEESVRRVAAEFGLPCVDVPALFDERSLSGSRGPDGVPDPEWFVDHVHPTIHGHQRIAAALADHFEAIGWIRQTDASRRRYERLAAEHWGSLGEDYFERGRQRLEGLRRWAAGRSAVPIDAEPDDANIRGDEPADAADSGDRKPPPGDAGFSAGASRTARAISHRTGHQPPHGP